MSHNKRIHSTQPRVVPPLTPPEKPKSPQQLNIQYVQTPHQQPRVQNILKNTHKPINVKFKLSVIPKTNTSTTFRRSLRPKLQKQHYASAVKTLTTKLFQDEPLAQCNAVYNTKLQKWEEYRHIIKGGNKNT